MTTSSSHSKHDGGASSEMFAYLLFGAIHEGCHVLAALCLASPSWILSETLGSFSWWLNILLHRQTVIEFQEDDAGEDVESQRNIIRHFGWLVSLSLALVISWMARASSTVKKNHPTLHEVLSNLQLPAWLTAIEAVATDLLRISSWARLLPTMAENASSTSPSHAVFFCGNFGVILLHHMWLQDKAGRDAALNCLEQMIQITMMRGAQSGGVVTYQPSSGSSNVSRRVRVVNRKRTDLSKELRKRITLASSLPNDCVPFLQGHTRFATSSLSSLDGTHPHQWSHPTVRRVYDFDSRTFGAKKIEIYITHNGDFEFYILNARTYEVGDVIAWLATVLHQPAPAMVDSMGVAGMIDILRCQGSFPLAARYVLAMGLRQSTMDIDKLRKFPTRSQFEKVGAIFEKCWNDLSELEMEQEHYSAFTDSITFRSNLARAVTNELLKNQLVLGPLQDYVWLSREEEGGNSVHAFCMLAVNAFLDHDLFYSTRVFLDNAKGSFGLSVSSSWDAHRQLVVAARGQTMSIAFYPDKGLVCYGSEQAATKAGINAKLPHHKQNVLDISQRETDVDRDATRLDLDDLGGEVVLLDFGSAAGKEALIGHRIVSKPSKNLPIHVMMCGALKMAIYQESKSSTLDVELYHRLTRLTRNDLIQPLPELTNDPVLQDLQDIPRVCRAIREDFESSKAVSGMNRLTAFHLAAVLRSRLDRRVKDRIAAESVDILLTGCEVSLWLAEQFAADFKKCFPKLSIQALSSNKILGLFGQEIQIPSVGFPQTSDTLNLNDSIVIIVSHSGGTFAPLACSNLLQSATKNIFVVTGDWDTQIGKNLRLMNQLEDGGEHVLNHRIFSTNIGIRPAEPCSLSVVATHQLLTNILNYLSVVILSDNRYRRVTGTTMTTTDIEILETCSQTNIGALTEIVGVNSLGYKLDKHSHTRKQLLGAGRLWSDHVLENVRAYIMCFFYIFATVVSGYPLFYAIFRGFGLKSEDRWMYAVKTIDALIYFFLPQICITLIRLCQGRNLLHRMVGRTVVIGDIPWVAQSAEAFLSKIFAVSYSIAGLNVISGNPADHLVHRHTHRVVRGTLAIFGRPDGRLSALSTAEAAVCLSANQASSIQSRGGTCETITLGHNPFKLDLALNGIFLKRHRPLFLCERLLVENDVKSLNDTEKTVDDDEDWRSSMLKRFSRAVSRKNVLDVSMSIHKLDTSITLRGAPKKRSAPALLGAYLDLAEAKGTSGHSPASGEPYEGRQNVPLEKVIADAIQCRRQDDRLQKFFRRMDTDGNGVISKDEFIAGLGTIDGLSTTEEEGVLLFNQADQDGSGTVSLKEFEHFIQNNGYGLSMLKFPQSHRDERGIIQIKPSSDRYFGAEIRKLNSGKKLNEEVDFELVRKQHLVQELYESRVASMQRFVSLCAMFHEMGRRVESFFSAISFGLWSYRIDRTHSIMRIATTASPISGASVRRSMEHLRLLKKVQTSVDTISSAYLSYKKRKMSLPE